MCCMQDVNDLSGTAHNLRKLSSTGGSGGVLDIFYQDWQLELAQNERFFKAVSSLWRHTWADPEAKEFQFTEPFDPTRGYFYLDRAGFRVPDHVSESFKKGSRPLQRSLTPHLDCCPSALWSEGRCPPHAPSHP